MNRFATMLRPHHVGLLCLLVAVAGWGLNWPAMKLVLREWPPLFARGTAGLAAALGLAFLAKARGECLTVPKRSIGSLLAAATTNVFVWMGFPSLSLLWLNVSEAALLVYTMPLWVTLLAWPFLGDRPTRSGLAALALGISGMGVLLGGQSLAVGLEKLPGALFALGAACLFALGMVTSRKPPVLPPLASVAWQVGIGCLPMVVIGLLFEKPELGGPCVTNASPKGLRSCMEDEGQALRSRLSGAGFKPPQAASVKSRCRERWGKRQVIPVRCGSRRRA